MKNKLSLEILRIIVVALVISVVANLVAGLIGYSYFNKATIDEIVTEWIREDDYDDFAEFQRERDDIFNRFEAILNMSIIIFFALFVYIRINKKISYVSEISEELRFIGSGRLDHRIEVKGSNEITSLAESINDMSRALEKHIGEERDLLKSEQQLITGISHDIRTPLSAIIGYLYVIKDKQYSSPEEEAQYLQIALDKSLRLQQLLDELLEMATLQEAHKKIEVHPMSLPSFEELYIRYVQDELNNSAPNISQVNLCVSNEAYHQIMLNETYTYRVMDNLISNVKKYALPGQAVDIYMVDADTFTELHIQNACDERTLEKSNQLLERFFKVDEARTDLEGAGLGLNICKAIMEKQGGYIKIKPLIQEKRIDIALGFKKENV